MVMDPVLSIACPTCPANVNTPCVNAGGPGAVHDARLARWAEVTPATSMAVRDVHVEAVNHPAHYGGDTVYEAIKVIEAWKLDFHTGNAVKYLSRAGRKDPTKTVEDLRKAKWYIERAITVLEGK
jgi:hypothetical protein